MTLSAVLAGFTRIVANTRLRLENKALALDRGMRQNARGIEGSP
jgi:hypothetical protein